MRGIGNLELRKRLHLACIVVLALGLLGATLAHFFSEEAPEDAVAQVVADGTVYAVAPNQSKRYIRDLERFGGKAAVVFDEIDRWFASLWHGRRLALTIGVISVAAALALFLFAQWLPPDGE